MISGIIKKFLFEYFSNEVFSSRVSYPNYTSTLPTLKNKSLLTRRPIDSLYTR